ncbi:hypothetical protein [Natrinema sp. 1APR25-10V2]|uniref:hypothetical protein n=1 Tax=Natrinema sp. 1APR25-10V2 TaxID=2951081 RepID=UPI0028765692|nr:hypothetical protein [Natrinema sp. 1APR25-10V2]MDS0476737.1 hypothetical protein [Natrinema sp. 1APR25-10V2]
MSTQHLTRPDAEPTTDRTRTQTAPQRAVADPRTATDRAPRTFSHRNTARLENLVDEWNTAFANATGDEAA